MEDEMDGRGKIVRVEQVNYFICIVRKKGELGPINPRNVVHHQSPGWEITDKTALAVLVENNFEYPHGTEVIVMFFRTMSTAANYRQYTSRLSSPDAEITVIT